MAEKRMFAKALIDSDDFLDMPQTAQLLYFHLCMRADDEGFINNPKRIMRDVRCGDDDLKVLSAKSYIIPFESGVIVIRHWKVHNWIRGDRIRKSMCSERAYLTTNDERVYELTGSQVTDRCQSDVSQVTDRCQSSGSQVTDKCQHSIDKISIDKISIDKNSIGHKPRSKFTPPTLDEINEYIMEKNLHVSAKQFFDYFTEGNWTDSKGNKVKNWKQKLLTWERFADKTEAKQDKQDRQAQAFQNVMAYFERQGGND